MYCDNTNNVHKSTGTLLVASKKFGLERYCEKPNVHVSLAECRLKACQR